MRRIQPVKRLRSLVSTKQRAAVLTLVLFLGLTAAAMPALHASTAPDIYQYMAVPELNLYSVDDEYTDGHTQYSISYPFIGEPNFDTHVANTVKNNKESFMQHLVKQSRGLFGQLQMHYTLHFYNDRYISLSMTTQQTIGDQVNLREETILYNRKAHTIVPLDGLFASDTYRKTLTTPLQKKLKKVLGESYDKKQVAEAIANVSTFIINKKQQLVLLFPVNTVAPPDRGVVAVTLDGANLRRITQGTIAKHLIDIPPAPAPKPKETKPEPTPPPAVNLTPTPVPQADPSGADCSVAQCLALTFDDGPAGPTSELLDILDANNARGTFFVLGQQAERYPGVIQRIQNSGHVVGNHTYDHQNLEQLSFADAAGQISRTGDAVQNITGIRPGIARAPYGAINHDLAASLGLPFIGWSLDPQDWLYRDPAHVCNAIVNGAHTGGIVLTHDIHQSSVDGLRCAIPQLIERGFTLVTVPQLLGFGETATPTIYNRR